MSITEKMFPDPWKSLRKDLFRNVEPSVELIALTQPTEKFVRIGLTSETIPAYTARHCWESGKKYGDNPEHNRQIDVQLTGNLISSGHTTPLQATNYVFDVSGISKSLQAQWTRHKIGVGWSFRSTRFVEGGENSFVYCTYDYIADELKVRDLLRIDESAARRAVEEYGTKRSLGATKQDARKIMPVEFATHCSFFANARALRHLFDLRLSKKAEWEIRRMTAMLLDEVMQYTPAIFQDIYNQHMDSKP